MFLISTNYKLFLLEIKKKKKMFLTLVQTELYILHTDSFDNVRRILYSLNLIREIMIQFLNF